MNRLWRSRKVTLLVLLVAFAVVAAACTSTGETVETATTTVTSSTISSTSAPDTATTSTEPGLERPYGGEVVIADTLEPPTLNTFLSGGDRVVVSRIAQGYAAGVQEVDGFTLELIPELVTELPTVGNGGVTVNEDGTMTVRYEIRDEAVWSDGTPISGADFQFTLDTIMDPDLPITRTTYEDVIEAEFTDKTFTYTLAFPTAQYELMFNEIIPKHAVNGTDFVADWNDTRWPSAGPFVFAEWAKGEFITLKRNENYWKTDAETGQRLPYLDQVTFKFFAEPESVIDAFKAREVDIISPEPTKSNKLKPFLEDIEVLQALEPQGARVEVLSGPTWEHVNFQFGPGRLERNENSCNDIFEMRLAVAQTIDKRLLTDKIFSGQVEPLDSYVTAYTPSLSNDNWSQYSVDNVAAAENYAKAVELAGKECSVVFTTNRNNDVRVETSELFVGMFEASGIPYENQLEDAQLFFAETLSNGTWDMSEWAWLGSPGISSLIDIHNVWDPEAPPPEGSNYYRWGSEDSSIIDDASVRFAEIRNEVNATIDENELVELFAEAEAILADNLVVIPLYARPVAAAVWEDEIGGFKDSPTFKDIPTTAGYTWNIEYWYRADLGA